MYNGYICKICHAAVTEKKHFWKEHKIAEADYFSKYEPKFDLLTGEQIPFKSFDSYVTNDFVLRGNLKKYLVQLSYPDAFKYLSNWIKTRKNFKNLVYSPSEFEFKMLQFPLISYLIKTYGYEFYRDICELSELKLLYNYSSIPTIKYEEIEFLIDSREQHLLKTNNYQIKKLDFGDYTTKNSDFVVERKTLQDALGTLSQGYDRFIREIERCVDDNGYIVVLIEEKQSNLDSYKFLPHTRHVKAEPVFIQHQIRELLLKYPTYIQFLAVDGTREAARVLEKIFRIEGSARNWDLQFLYNKGVL